MFGFSDSQIWDVIFIAYFISVFIYPIFGILTVKKQLPKLIDEIEDEELRDIIKSLRVRYEFRPFTLGSAAVYAEDVSKGYNWLVINTWWFNTHSRRIKVFVLCHEAMHVKLKHHEFCWSPTWNEACDIVINQMLVDKYGFEEDDIKRFATIKNCFPFWKRKRIKRNQSEEYYYVELCNKWKIISTKMS